MQQNQDFSSKPTASPADIPVLSGSTLPELGSGKPTGGRVVAHNARLNLAGRTISLAIAILAVPYVIRRLGPDQFGLLSLAWIVVGYFALLDLGIGTATTKFVAEYLGKGDTDAVPKVVWSAVLCQSCLGIGAGILLAAASGLLADRVLKIPAGLHGEARLIFIILAFSLPIDLANGSFQGMLMASQRFDLVNAIGVPSSALTYLVPAVALALGFGLPLIVLVLVIARAATLAASFAVCTRLYPSLVSQIGFNRRLARQLLGFGGWVTISNAVGPVLVYFDRFLIGGLISIAAVGFYTPAYMISTKLWIIPGSLMATLFPAFSASAARGDAEWLRRAFARSMKFLLLIVGPGALFLIFFAHSILEIWLGARYAAEGAPALEILAAGVLINSLGNVPYGLLQGAGRPDLTAKFHLIELPIHVGLAWMLVLRFGLAGAALAWTIRVSIDFLLLIYAACRLNQMPLRLLFSSDLGRSVGTLAVAAAGLWLFWGMSHTLMGRAVFSAVLGAAFAAAAWRYILSPEERWQLKPLLRMGH